MNVYLPQLIERISAIPGVRSASLGGFIPNPAARKDSVSLSATDPERAPGVQANVEMISPGFFRTLGIGLLSGRDFEWTDDGQHLRTAMISRSLAERLFPNGDATGQHIRFGFVTEFQKL